MILSRYIVSLLLCLTSLSALNAQTIVNSYNGVDTIWEKSKSPYLITGDINVPAGKSLTIQPGTRVLFKGNFGININDGSFYCRGTATDKIVIQGDSMVTTGDSTLVFYIYWRGIKVSRTFVSGEPAKAFDMQYCVMKYSGGINTEGNVKTLLDHCEFYKNAQCFSSFTNSSTDTDSLSYCTIRDNTSVFGYILNRQTSIVNSDIHDNDLFIEQMGRTFRSISNSRIIKNGIVFFSAIKMENTVFENLYCGQTGPNSCKNTISLSADTVAGCTFKNSKINNAYQLLVRKSMSDTRMEGFHVAVKTAASAASKVRINRCNFYNNDTAILLSSVNNFSNIITCNNIEYNNNGIVCSSAQTDSIKNNIICNNKKYNVVNGSVITQNLTQNCFCSETKAQVESRLYDKADDNTVGSINYNVYGPASMKNCQTLDTVVAKDPAALGEADTTLGVDMNCVDYKGPVISLNTKDTICHQLNTPYTPVQPTVTSAVYISSMLGIDMVSAGVNPNAEGMYQEVWRSQDPSGKMANKIRYVRVSKDCGNNQSLPDISTMAYRIGPNPANTELNIYAPESANAKQIILSLTSMDGRTVYKSEMHEVHTVIDLSDFPPGIYSLLVMQDNQAFSSKILVRR